MADGESPGGSDGRGGDRAFGLVPRRRLTARVGGAAVLLAAVVVTIVLATGPGSARPSRSSHRVSAASVKYGTIPAWLPKPTPPANRIVAATAARPALAAVEGDTVSATLTSGSAMVTAVGPAIPNWVDADVHSGHWNTSSTAPTTFDVTFAAPHGTVPLRARDFSILTGEGQIIHPALAALDGSRVRARVSSGTPVTIKLLAGLGEGDGALRWAPQGPRVLVAWFYQLEFD